MLKNIHEAGHLAGLARRKKSAFDFQSIRNSLVEEELAKGWTIERRNKTTTRLKKPKAHHVMFEDRVWALMYRMGFRFLSGDGGAYQVLNGDGEGPAIQIDVVAIDDEVAIAVECKATTSVKNLPGMDELLGKLVSLRAPFTRSVRTQYPLGHKRLTGLLLFTANYSLSVTDRERAKSANVVLMDDSELDYYEALVAQIGAAARYQFLADMFPGKSIPGLEITVPAVKTKFGPYDGYSFAISPEYLVKIAYVSHRAKGKASDVDAYQRMLKRSRLVNIRQYISDGGIFPTNIVLNAPSKYLQFDRAKQESTATTSLVGWLRLRPAYKTAWVIDGQHRLYAYADHPHAKESTISVLCFADLEASEQARLFVDINAEQRKVKQNLLQELFAELHWDSNEPNEQVKAIVSKAIQALDSEKDSPFYKRILKADDRRTDTRCISLTSIYRAIDKSNFYIARVRNRKVVEYGPLWAGDPKETLRRTVAVLKGWFGSIRLEAREVWDLGAGEGGGLAMNDGITVCIYTLKSVFQHLSQRGLNLVGLEDDELVEAITPYAIALGKYFGGMSAEAMRGFRALRGGQGHTTGTRRCQQALNSAIPAFEPAELREFLKREKAETNKQAYEVITAIETMLQETILDELKQEFKGSETDWWFGGVPKSVRKKIDDRINEDGGKRGGREQNFDLIDYREVIRANWQLFEPIFAFGKGNKDARTSWIAEVNEIRKIVMHASRGAHLPVTEEQLARLDEIRRKLVEQISARADTELVAAGN